MSTGYCARSFMTDPPITIRVCRSTYRTCGFAGSAVILTPSNSIREQGYDRLHVGLQEPRNAEAQLALEDLFYSQKRLLLGQVRTDLLHVGQVEI